MLLQNIKYKYFKKNMGKYEQISKNMASYPYAEIEVS